MSTYKILLSVTFLFLISEGWTGEQALPSCRILNSNWLNRYYDKLRPNWNKVPLACDKKNSQLDGFEKLNIQTARAAYVLDSTVFYRQNVPVKPIVSYGRIQAPPASMLEWVSARSKNLIFDDKADSAYADTDKGQIHLTPADFGINAPLTVGIGLGAQLIHEARHLGFPFYFHVECNPPQSGENCDPTISEEFELGGSHATAAIWLGWIATRSYWPSSERMKAVDVATWVLRYRLNTSNEVKNAFSVRWLGRPFTMGKKKGDLKRSPMHH